MTQQPLPKVKLSLNAPWRRRTSIWYLEQLKRELIDEEQKLLSAEREINARESRDESTLGFIESAVYFIQRSMFESAHEKVSFLTTRIENIVEGNVNGEVLSLEEKAAKIKREQQERKRNLSEVEKKLERVFFGKADLRASLEEIRIDIKAADLELIELASGIKELKEIDVGKLYRELGVAAETIRVESEQLTEIKKKADLVSQIRPPQTAATPAKHPDDERMRAAKEHRRRDIQFDTEIRLGTKLQTLEEIQTWRKQQRRRVIAMPEDAASEDEKLELFEEIDRAVEREKKRLRDNVEIYEED